MFLIINNNIRILNNMLHSISVISPRHHIGIDFIGPISPQSTKGDCYILTISDYFSKWMELYLLLANMQRLLLLHFFSSEFIYFEFKAINIL